MMKKKYAIIGLGETGFSVAGYLQNKHIPFLLMDTREHPPKRSEFKEKVPEAIVSLGGFSKAVLQDVDRVILSPGISKNNPDLKHALPSDAHIIGDIELFAEANRGRAKVIAITGS